MMKNGCRLSAISPIVDRVEHSKPDNLRKLVEV